MRRKTLTNLSLLGLMICINFNNTSAIMITDTIVSTYPYAVFSSQNPSIGEKITVKWILGIDNDECVPQYETSVVKTIIPSKIIRYTLEYKNSTRMDEKAVCAEALTPYGPSFEIGPFEADHDYEIYINTELIKVFPRIPPSKYPYALINPRSPLIGDDLSVRLVLGEDSLSCVPQYSGVIVSRTILKSNPPVFVFNVVYEKLDVEYIACLPRTTLYGPEFDLGLAEKGKYQIYTEDSLITEFYVNNQIPQEGIVTSYPSQPSEGDSLTLQLIEYRGSSSCAPQYRSSFELVSSSSSDYIYNLKYERTATANQEACTDDYVPVGPTWTFPAVKPGNYLFFFNETDHYKVYVQKKKSDYDFDYVTIKGRVFGGNEHWDSLLYDLPVPVVPQCTVALVFFKYDSTLSKEQIVNTTPQVSFVPVQNNRQFYSVTDEKGVYTIKDVPVSLLKNGAYTVAIKNGSMGYGTIPPILTKEIISNILLLKYDVFVDSTKNIFPQTDSLIRYLKDLSSNQDVVIKNSIVTKNLNASIAAAKGRLQITNPSSQKISIDVFSMNGKKIWSQKAIQLSGGIHSFTIPTLANGIFLTNVKGDNFMQSKVFTITQ